MLHCKCGLKSTVKLLFNTRISVDGGNLDDSVSCFIVFWIQFRGRSRKETMFYTLAELS